MNISYFLILFLLVFLNLACQTSRLKDFDKLMMGQEKDKVLESLGGPTYHERLQGQDRWTYIIYESDIRHEKVIYFLDGYLTYKGLPVPPIISAEEQDDINSEKNIQLAIKDQLDYETYLKNKSQISNVPQIKSGNSGENR
jgi:outer membrane protein assembly factor BamE (lipoprotein component of BamABCDE complex)